MSGVIKQKARASAERCVPLGIFERAKIAEAFVNGYMAGHAAHTRSASKRASEFREIAVAELKAVEKEIGVPSKALKLIYESSVNGNG